MELPEKCPCICSTSLHCHGHHPSVLLGLFYSLVSSVSFFPPWILFHSHKGYIISLPCFKNPPKSSHWWLTGLKFQQDPTWPPLLLFDFTSVHGPPLSILTGPGLLHSSNSGVFSCFVEFTLNVFSAWNVLSPVFVKLAFSCHSAQVASP